MIVGISMPYRVSFGAVRRFLAHRDPLVEASNWVAFIIGTHLPFWPLYVSWAAGPRVLPTALLTLALAPIFVAIPLLSRRNGLLGRIAMLLTGVANTIFTIWVLGEQSGTAFFLIPWGALASALFRPCAWRARHSGLATVRPDRRRRLSAKCCSSCRIRTPSAANCGSTCCTAPSGRRRGSAWPSCRVRRYVDHL
jgi:hypothetical protein